MKELKITLVCWLLFMCVACQSPQEKLSKIESIIELMDSPSREYDDDEWDASLTDIRSLIEDLREENADTYDQGRFTAACERYEQMQKVYDAILDLREVSAIIEEVWAYDSGPEGPLLLQRWKKDLRVIADNNPTQKQAEEAEQLNNNIIYYATLPR